jgi:hypothetical protein
MRGSWTRYAWVSSLCVLIVHVAAAPAFAQSDTAPPQLIEMTISPAMVDVTAGPKTVIATVHVTDDLSGIDLTSGNRIRVQLRSPSGQSVGGANVVQAGIALDGVYPINITIPRYAEPGIWNAFVFLRDNIGNSVTLTTDVLAAAGFAHEVSVADLTPDLAAPTLTAISFSPSDIDVSGGDAAVTVDLGINDNVSGVTNLISGVDFTLTSPSGQQRAQLPWIQFHLVTGTTTSGTWRATLIIPQYAEPGTWTLTALTVRDLAFNTRFYIATDLAVFGSARTLSITSLPSDTTPPVLTSVTITPAFVNTSIAAQTVEVQVSANDDLSGVSFVPLNGFLSPNYANFMSPSGAQRASFFSFAASGILPIAGTPLNGTWSLPVTLPQFSESGTWPLSVQVKDAATNRILRSSAQLASAGFASSLVVIQPSLATDGTVGPIGGTITDSAFGARAELIIPPGEFSVPTSVAIDVLASPLSIPLPSGFSSAETYFVNVQLTPQPTFPLPAPGLTIVLPLRNYLIPGTSIDLFRVDPVTAQLTPALDLRVQAIRGFVDVGWMTATFVGVARFSTIVGLLPNAVSVIIDIKPGDTPNVLNLKSNGKVAVAILSTPTFDVSTAQRETIRFSART